MAASFPVIRIRGCLLSAPDDHCAKACEGDLPSSSPHLFPIGCHCTWVSLPVLKDIASLCLKIKVVRMNVQTPCPESPKRCCFPQEPQLGILNYCCGLQKVQEVYRVCAKWWCIVWLWMGREEGEIVVTGIRRDGSWISCQSLCMERWSAHSLHE